jgi:YbbR domain-containing protein
MKYRLITIAAITIFSILLWVFVSFSNDYSTTIRVPVLVQNIPNGFAIKDISTNEVSLSIKGEGWELAQLTFGGDHTLNIYALTEEKSKTLSVRNILEQNSWVSSKVQVTLVEPEQISYEFEEINYKEVTVESNIKSNFKVGYGPVSNIKISPDTVRISGAKSIVQSMISLLTDSTTFSNVDDNLIVEVPLIIPEGINSNVKKVTISLDVQKIVDKTFVGVEIERIGVPPSRELSLFPERVNVVLRGGINMLGKFTNDDIQMHVNFRQALEDTLGSIEPHILFPEFTTLVDIRPGRLDYIIKQF